MAYRPFVTAVALALALCAVSAEAQYPSRPIRLIVPAAPGGGTDITPRGCTPAFQEARGQSGGVENRGGAGGVVGSAEVARAAPDGYTLMMVYISHATNPTLVDKLPYDTGRDFTPATPAPHAPAGRQAPLRHGARLHADRARLARAGGAGDASLGGRELAEGIHRL